MSSVSLFLCSIFLVTVGTLYAALPIEQATRVNEQQTCDVTGICRIYNGTVTGTLTLRQQRPNSPVSVSGRISGLEPGLHGFHVHQYGDLSNGCTNAGGHYNPFRNDHGAPTDSIRHLGDLGNIEAGSNGIADINISDNKLRLCGALSIMGRAVVVHARADDLGRGGNDESKRTGNAGARLGCCVIAQAPAP